jgi:hypothetical protein
LPARALRAVVVCEFCGVAVAEDGGLVHAAAFRRALSDLSRDDGARPRVEVAGLPYRVLGRLAHGESSDVFLAERAQPITERVLIKVLRADADADLLDREWEALTALHRSEADGADEVARRIPDLVNRGRVAGHDGGPSKGPPNPPGGGGQRALVLRAASGFVDTFVDVMRAYPAGVPGEHAVWMWRRTLELLAGVHRCGWAHGALLPQHHVVHARDHGVMLVGWSCAARLGGRDPLPAIFPEARDVYAPALISGAPPSAATDITTSARAIARLLGGTAERVPPSVPTPLGSLVERVAAGAGGDDAWALRQEVGHAAGAAYGPPRFHPFAMPGWG